MRQTHFNVTSGLVHARARESLAAVLPWHDYGESVSVHDLLDLLLLMVTSGGSLFSIVRRFFSFSHETGSRAVKANLPTSDRLVRGLVDALFDTARFSRQDRRRKWLVAIDSHYVPYYGEHTPHVVGGQRKLGTKWFHGYATTVLLHKGRRYTIGLIPLTPKMKPHEMVRTLLQQIREKGLKIKGVVLDSGFDSGETFLLLQEFHLAYTVPLRRKGNSKNARNSWFEGRHKQIRWVEWYVKDTRKKVRTRTILWKGRQRTMLFAFQGWNDLAARNVFEEAAKQTRLYRKRFGIETSYRQKNQAKATTTSRDPVYRLLLEGLGYLIRQLWVVLTRQLRGSSASDIWIAVLPMLRMLDWLFHELTKDHQEAFTTRTT